MRPRLPDTADATLAAVERGLRVKRAADARLLELAAHWADQHPEAALQGTGDRGSERAVRLGGEGTPLVCEFAPAELGVSLEIHPLAARNLIADALDLRHRLPGLWDLVVEQLAMPDWVARKVAALTRALSWAQVAEVDTRLAEVAASLPPSRLLRLVEAMVLAADDEEADAARDAARQGRFVTLNQATVHGTKGLYAKLDVADAIRLDAEVDRLARILATRGDRSALDVRRSQALGLLANPAAALRLIAETEPEALDADLVDFLKTVDPKRLRPRVDLVIHVTESDFTKDAHGVARFENGGPITLAHAREILGHAHVTIRPVIDLAHQLPTDAYEFTGSLRESVLLRTPADCFPYAVSTSRRMQIDHTTPYAQTRQSGALPARPDPGRQRRTPDPTIITGSPPTGDGDANNPHPASSSGARHAAATGSPTTPAPTPSTPPPAAASSTAPHSSRSSARSC